MEERREEGQKRMREGGRGGMEGEMNKGRSKRRGGREEGRGREGRGEKNAMSMLASTSVPPSCTTPVQQHLVMQELPYPIHAAKFKTQLVM